MINYEGKGTSNWRTDFNTLLPECIDSFEPCFILFRIDEPGWLFIRYFSTLL